MGGGKVHNLLSTRPVNLSSHHETFEEFTMSLLPLTDVTGSVLGLVEPVSVYCYQKT